MENGKWLIMYTRLMMVTDLIHIKKAIFFKIAFFSISMYIHF